MNTCMNCTITNAERSTGGRYFNGLPVTLKLCPLHAAAPALLEALKKAVAYGPNLSQAWFDEARDAITAVKGES